MGFYGADTLQNYLAVEGAVNCVLDGIQDVVRVAVDHPLAVSTITVSVIGSAILKGTVEEISGRKKQCSLCGRVAWWGLAAVSMAASWTFAAAVLMEEMD